jgi:hypothetical protein
MQEAHFELLEEHRADNLVLYPRDLRLKGRLLKGRLK